MGPLSLRLQSTSMDVRVWVGVLGSLALAAQAPAPPAQQAADLVFRGGMVFTADPARPAARAVAVKDGRIAYVGDDAGVQPFTGRSTRIMELGGDMLVPGFHDSHIHLASGGLRLLACDLARDASAQAIVAHVVRCARERLKAAWITGSGWQPSAFADILPTRLQLDAVIKDRPAFFGSADGRMLWANSRALDAAGITAATPDPPGGRIDRDPLTREPTGVLRDLAGDLVRRAAPRPSQQDYEEAILRALVVANSFGITSVHDAMMEDAVVPAFVALDKRSALTARVTASAMLSPAVQQTKDVPDEIVRLGRLRTETWGNRFRMIGVKVGVDGALDGRTAALLEPYAGTTDLGPTLVKPDVLQALVVALDRAKFTVHVHAIGDRATRMSLDAVAAARAENGLDGPIHQIAHLQLVHPTDIARFAALRVAANVQGLWACRDPETERFVEPLLGSERSRRLYPLGSLARAGVLIVGGSDWSVTSMNPVEAMQVAVTRRGLAAEAGPAWLPDEAMTLGAMLGAYTINGARIQQQDDQVGSIVVGKAADLVVLDRDVTAIPAATVAAARVRFTFVEGRQVHPIVGNR